MNNTLHYLLMANHMSLHKRLFASVKDTGLTHGQPKILDYLKDHNGAVQKEIASSCHIEPASLTSILNGMERKGLIIRKIQDDNRRAFSIFLTEKGKELMERVDFEFQKIDDKCLSGFSEEEKITLNEYLERIYKNLHNNKIANGDDTIE